jgi:thiamine-phosphate pyrophosphorylase
MMLPKPRLLLITDRAQARRPLPEVVDAALAGGCRWISVREKDLPNNDRRKLCRDIVRRGEAHGATVTLHGDLAGAEAARAAGVHVPFGTAPGAVKQILGKQALVGVSVHSWAEAERAQEDGADYLTVSPIFQTESKPDYGPAVGLEILGEFCAALRTPVVALGGITPATARQCLDAGAAGVAVMGEVMRAEDPGAAVAAFLESLTA